MTPGKVISVDAIDPLVDPQVLDDPYPYYTQLRTRDPVHLVRGTQTYLVTRPELIRQVIADTETFSSATSSFLHVDADGTVRLRSTTPGDIPEADVPSVLAVADPPDHTRQRRVLSRVFSPAAVARRERDIREIVARLLEPHLRPGPLDWMAVMAEPLPSIVLARILGLDDDAAPFLKEFGYAAVEQIGGFVDAERGEEIQARMSDLGPVADAYTQALTGNGPGPDTVLGACADAVRTGQLNDLEVISILLMLVSAGSESTASLLGTGALLMAKDQSLQQALRAQPELLSAFVEEACRLDPPFRGHYRRVTRPTELAGVALPQDARLVLMWPAANRDESVFDRPDQVQIDRRGIRQHLGFGWGPHLCIGAPLARLEARLAFEHLLAATTFFHLDDRQAPPTYLKSLMIRRLVSLPLVLQIRPEH